MPTTKQLHRAARVEDALNVKLFERFSSRGWTPHVIAYTGYGAPGWVRVMARVILRRPEAEYDATPAVLRRGYRAFFTVPIVDAPLIVRAGNKEHRLVSDRGGYIDDRLECDLPSGWHEITVGLQGTDLDSYAADETGGRVAQVIAKAPVTIIDPSTTIGIISDVDDTVMVTTLPRAMLAAWNTFVLNENARRQVTGMSVLYERLHCQFPGGPFIYLSTGAWNVAPTLRRFLSRNLYPRGPLLLTDWGPTHNAWFRSGQLHKRRSLFRLAQEFPDIRWLLIGDDGQHDPEIYAEFARIYPGHVAAVAIRTLSPTEQLLASGLPAGSVHARTVPGTPWVQAPDGAALWRRLSEIDLEDGSAAR